MLTLAEIHPEVERCSKSFDYNESMKDNAVSYLEPEVWEDEGAAYGLPQKPPTHSTLISRYLYRWRCGQRLA